MKYKVKELKLKINEVTLPKAVKILTPGDILRINGDKNGKTYTNEFRVISITNDQVFASYDKYKIMFSSFSFYNTNFDIVKMENGKKAGKVTLNGVKSIDIVRNGNVLDTISNSEEETKGSEEKTKDSEEKVETDKTNNEFETVLNSLNNGDILKISTGVNDSITELLFRVDDINYKNIVMDDDALDSDSKEKVVDLELINSFGANPDEYNQIKTFNSVNITAQSLKVDKSGNTLILDILLGGKSSKFYIKNVLDFEKTENTVYNDEKENVDSERDERIKNKIINNPRLQAAMIRKPSLLDRLFGNHKPKGIIPFMDKMGKLGDDASKLVKGNKVEFRFLSDNIGTVTNNLKRGNTYSGRLKDRDTIEIFISNKVKWIIDLKNGIGDDEFSGIVSLVLTDIKQSKSISKIKEKAEIKITNYDF